MVTIGRGEKAANEKKTQILAGTEYEFVFSFLS